jgi:hypothetical protein
MAKYGKKASSKVEKAMHERKRGTLKSGRSGKTVKSRKQAIAIGLSEARREGAKVPAKKKSSSSKTKKSQVEREQDAQVEHQQDSQVHAQQHSPQEQIKRAAARAVRRRS